MVTIDDLLNAAAVVRDEDQEQENTAFRVGTLLVNVIQYLSSLITSEDAKAAISDALADFFVEGALKQSALPPAFMSSLRDWAAGVAEIESTTYLLKLIHSRIILLDSMGSTLDGLDYTPAAGDLVWRTGYVWKYNGSDFEDGGIPPKSHVVYVNKHTSKMYMWNGDSMKEVGNHYDDKIQISKMDQTAVSDIPVGKLHYIPSQSKLVYRISASKTHSWTPRADLIYIDISSNTLYRWQGSSFQKVTSSGSGGGSAGVSAFENYEACESISALPGQGVATTGYIVGTHIYAYVNTGGDTKDGKYQDLGTLDAAGMSVTTSEDGTFTIHVGSDSYTVNLNHTHENMCKLVVCEESDLPSTLDPATIYGVNDGGEIGMLYVGGYPFYGGGGGSGTAPVLRSPADGASIDMGEPVSGVVSKAIKVKGKNLTQPLTVELSGTGFAFAATQPSGVTVVSTTQLTVTAAAANSLNGAVVTVEYSGSTYASANAALGITSSEISAECTLSYDMTDGLIADWDGADAPVSSAWVDKVNNIGINLYGSAAHETGGYRFNNLSTQRAAYASIDQSFNTLLNSKVDKEFTCIVQCTVQFSSAGKDARVIDFGSYGNSLSGIAVQAAIYQEGKLTGGTKVNGATEGFAERIASATGEPFATGLSHELTIKLGARLLDNGKQEVYSECNGMKSYGILDTPVTVNFNGVDSNNSAAALGITYTEPQYISQLNPNSFANVLYRRILIFNKAK